MTDDDKKANTNRFGFEARTDIPDDAPLNRNPGHKLRTSNTIVNRAALTDEKALLDSYKLDKRTGQKIQFVTSGSQIGVVRLGQDDAGDVPEAAPQLVGIVSR